MAFKFVSDAPKGTRKYATPASTTIGVGYPLKVSSNALALATSGAKAWYLAQGTKASSDSATTAIEVVPIRKSDIFLADIGTGTMADSYVGSTCDFKSGATSTLDLTADTNHDVTIIGWDGVDTTKCLCVFTSTVF